ncbi:hypothetical protein B0F90DRAFT_630253 [Multifurca ochricompacta]|uniref:Crinkler effector protein N-terminal domain-containing protein n=1 Tax=Multifurca ochricompacta TaxID=376703 RepID=A0AAD4QK22_9AGAM|nr:hypothetical protein B0F90DRAFT_630253 [Multifurca ochricompacta]
MATILTLFCLAIDNQKEVIGNIFNVKIQSDDYASDLKDAIKAKMANQLSHVDADQLIIWKLLKLQCIDLATNKISDAIKVFDFSSSRPFRSFILAMSSPNTGKTAQMRATCISLYRCHRSKGPRASRVSISI